MKKIKMLSNSVVLLALLMMNQSLMASNASASPSGVGAAFSSGTTSFGLILGSGQFNNNNYLILGGSVGYYLVKGLEVGVDIEHWATNSPAITKVSPQVRYVFTQPKVAKPYVGTFYRRTFFSNNISDQNSYGFRTGAYFSTSNNVYIGGGIVYEKYQNCKVFNNCSETYPEIIISFSF